MAELAPVKTRDRYDKDWADFKAWIDQPEGHVPNEADFIRYFNFVNTERKLKVSTLRVIYSRLNNNMKRT